jgi:hypothetical protein
VYHNGAESYCAARAFRGSLRVEILYAGTSNSRCQSRILPLPISQIRIGSARSPLTGWKRWAGAVDERKRKSQGKHSWPQSRSSDGGSDRQMRSWRERYEEFGFRGLFDRRQGKSSPKRVPVATLEPYAWDPPLTLLGPSLWCSTLSKTYSRDFRMGAT